MVPELDLVNLSLGPKLVTFSPFSSLFLYFLLCWDSVAARGLSLVVVRGLLIVVASPVMAHGLWSVQAQ